ncbi:hypothetical protein COCNU_14G011100 [Cocos nucifera]|uniref:Uncharacterized protein n=1 Tax=Cocos nucifera TaxID=13894 RepID=A0A8K0IVU1_COCNU|nr:hypothetical protein COCNU_14G011100 [Cocos nucifera]
MPGNEVAERIHNFPEQESLSQILQSQVQESWPVLNNNLWVGTQRQNGVHHNFDSKNYIDHSSESEQGNGRQSLQVPFGTDLMQSTLNIECARNQSRGQEFNSNGSMHGSHGLHPSSNQVGFLRDGTTSDSHSLPPRGLQTLELQQGKAPEYSSGLKRSSERSDVVEAPANFGFFGGQQQLIMSQHPGLSQPSPRQQQGFNDMQLWQQHLMHKQLQEIQRQQQLQQLDQGGRPRSLHAQLPGVARQAVVDQFPGVLNGMPVGDSSNYMCSNEHAEGELKTPRSSHMLLAGNMSMAQCSGSPMHGISNGLTFSHDQGQLMQPLGFVPRLDQSLNGMPVSYMRGSSTYFSQFQGMSHDCADASIKADGNQAEKSSIRSSARNCFQSDHFMVPDQGCLQDSVLIAKQSFQGKGSFASASVQGSNVGATSGNCCRTHHVSHNLQAQEFQGRQEENDWSGSLQEEAMMQIKPSCGGSSLDPTKEKLLFGTDDDGNCTSSFESSIINSTGFLHDKPLESNDCFGAFPSIQSGSWNALMQESVEASSSNSGLHEEWSGLSFQKMDLSSGNRSAALSDNRKQQMVWDDSKQQSASSMTSRPFPLFNDADASSNCHTAPSFLHPTRFAHKLNERVSTDASHESIQQPSKEASDEHLDQSHQQKQSVGKTFQAQMHFDNVSNCVQEGQMYEQSVNFAQSTGMELNLQSMQVLVHQQKMPLPNVNSQLSNKPNGWNINGSLSPDKLKAHDNNVTNQDATFHMEKNYDTSIWKVGRNEAAVSFPSFSGGLQPITSDSGSPRVSNDDACMGDFAAITTSSTLTFNQEINHQVLNRQQVDHGKHVAVDSSVKYKGDENFTKYQNQLSRGQHAWGLSLNNTDQGSSETYNNKQENSLPEEVANEGYDFRPSHPTLPADPRGCARENLAGNEHHPLVINGQKLSGQSSWKILGPHRFQYHPKGNLGMNMEIDSQSDRAYSQSTPHLVVQGLKNQEQPGHFVGYSAVHMGKGHLIGIQRSAKGTEEIQYKSTIPGHDSDLPSFDGSAFHFSQNRSAGRSSQNMLDLLHKMDQSRERNTVACFSDSDHGAPSEISESAVSDGSAHLQHSQSSVLKGFSLKLAPPSQRKPLSSHFLPSQSSLQALNGCDSKDLDSGAGDKDQMWLTSTSTTKILSIPPHETSEVENLDNESSISGQTSKSSIYENSLAPSSLPYAWNKDISNANELAPMDHSARPFGSQAGVDGHSEHSSHPNVTDDSIGGALADQSALVYSLDSGHSQLINANIHIINSGQQLSLVETKSIDQHSATAGFSQQGGFSTMLNNVSPSISSQQCLAGAQPQKTVPIVNQSTSPLPGMRITNSGTMRITVDDRNSRGSAPCEFGASYIDSFLQNMPDKVDVAPMKGSASQGQEVVQKHLSDGNSAISVPSPICPHQEDLNRAKHGQDSIFASLYHDKGISERTVKSLDAHPQNYSLLQQMKVKDVEPDPSKQVGKRLKGADFDSNAVQMGWTRGQRFIFGQNPVLKELDASIQHSSFPSVVKMLSFSSKENEDKSASTCSQITGIDFPSQDLLASTQHDMQNHANSPIKSSKSAGNEQPQISPQMASSWFGQYGAYKNRQILAMHDGLSNSQRTAKGATFVLAKVSESMHNSTLVEQGFNSSKFSNLQQNTSSTIIATTDDSPSRSLPLDAIDNNVILMPKKRKSATLELLPWHKELIIRVLSYIYSMAELDWAQAANRLIEKIGDEFEMMEDCSSITRLWRRLVLTTLLMQQLIPSVPARFLNADATASNESLAYFVAKLALGDACSLVSCSGNDSHMLLNHRKMRSEELKSSEKEGDSFFSEVMGNFIGRLEELKSNILRSIDMLYQSQTDGYGIEKLLTS